MDTVNKSINKKRQINDANCRFKKRLRKKQRDGAIVDIRIVSPVSIEVKLAVVPVEDRSARPIVVTVETLFCFHLSVAPELEYDLYWQ